MNVQNIAPISEPDFQSILTVMKKKINNKALPLDVRQMSAIQIAAAALGVKKFNICLKYCDIASMYIFPFVNNDEGRYRMLFFMKATCLFREHGNKDKVREYLSSEILKYQKHANIQAILKRMKQEINSWKDDNLKECPVLLKKIPKKDFHTLQCRHKISSEAYRKMAETSMMAAQKKCEVMKLKCPICRHVQKGYFIFVTTEAILMTLFENEVKINPPCLAAALNDIQLKLESPFMYKNQNHHRRESYLFYTEQSLASLEPLLSRYKFQLIKNGKVLKLDARSREFKNNVHLKIESSINGVFIIVPRKKNMSPYVRIKANDPEKVTEAFRRLHNKGKTIKDTVTEFLKFPSVKVVEISSMGFNTDSFKIIRVDENDMLNNV